MDLGGNILKKKYTFCPRLGVKVVFRESVFVFDFWPCKMVFNEHINATMVLIKQHTYEHMCSYVCYMAIAYKALVALLIYSCSLFVPNTQTNVAVEI